MFDTIKNSSKNKLILKNTDPFIKNRIQIFHFYKVHKILQIIKNMRLGNL